MRNARNARRYIVALAVAVLSASALVGCGGGGGGGGTSTAVVDPTLSVPFQTAVSNLVNTGYSKNFVLSGWINNGTLANPAPNTPLSGSGTETRGPASSYTFTSGPLSGTVALRQVDVVTGSYTDGTTTTPLATTTTSYWDPSTYTLLAVYDGTNWWYYSPYTNPASVMTASTGALGSASTGGAMASTENDYYSVAADSATSLLVTLTGQINEPTLASTISTQTVYRVTTTGTLTPVSATATYSMTSPWKSITLTYQ